MVLPKHTFYVDNIFVYQPLPFVKSMYYMDLDLYRYFIGRADQSVNESVMVKRVDQQLRVTRHMIDCQDLDALKGSKDRSTDISQALEEAAKANPWAFGEDGGVGRVDTGAAHGTPPTNDTDGVEAAFKAMNPELKL